MYSWAFISTMFLMPVIFADTEGLDDSTKQQTIFGARCEARCFAKSQECRTCHQACDMPCKDENFYKVKSCTAYCKKWLKERIYYNECKSSCKLLMKLYNTGGGKKHKHLLPDTPKGLNSTLVASKKKTTITRVTWSYSNPQNSVLFMIETRYYTEKTLFNVGEWEFLLTTNATSVLIIPRTAAWSEYRVMSINEYGTSDYSSPSKPVYVMPTRPSPPRHFRIENMMRIKDSVSVWLAWSKPLVSDVPVHRYRLFWSRQLDRHTKQFHSLRVHHRKINGDIYSVILHGLATNTTFKFELQAICHVKGKRLRSKRAVIKSRTLDKVVETKKPVKVKKTLKSKVMKNSHLQVHGKTTRLQTGSSKKVNSTTQLLPTEINTAEEATTNESSPTEDQNTLQALRAHNSSSNTLIRSWVVLLAIVTSVTYLLF